MAYKKDEITVGRRFGRLAILADAGVDYNRKRQVLVLCDCGTLKIIRWSNINRPDDPDLSPRRRPARSCGCESSKAFERNMAEFVRRIPKWIRREMWKEYQKEVSIEEITRTYGRNRIANMRAIREYHLWWKEKHPKQAERIKDTGTATITADGIADLSETVTDPQYVEFLTAFEKVRPSGLLEADEPEESAESKSTDLLMEFESATEPVQYCDSDDLPDPEPPELPFDSEPPNYSQGLTFDDDPAMHGFEAVAVSPVSAEPTEPPEWLESPTLDESRDREDLRLPV